MKPSQRWRLAAGALLAVLLLLFFFRGVDWAALGARLARRPTGSPWPGVVLVDRRDLRAPRLALGVPARAPRRASRYRDLFSATMVGLHDRASSSRAPARCVRPYLVSRRHPIRTSAGFATIILERLVDLITVLAALRALPLRAARSRPQQTQGPLLGVLKARGRARRGSAAPGRARRPAAPSTGTRTAAMRAARPRARRASRRGSAGPLGQAPARLRARASPCCRPRRRTSLAIVGQSVLVWLAIALGFHLNNRAFGIDLPFHATFLLIAFLTVGVAIPTPGHGGRLPRVLPARAHRRPSASTAATAAAAGIAAHALTNLPVLVLGLALPGPRGAHPREGGGDDGEARPKPDRRSRSR